MGKKITILASIFIMVASSLKSQNYVWAKSLAGTDMDQGKSVAVDASGNVFTTGTFRGTVDFDPGAGSASLTSAGSDDMFISKLDASGNYVWAYAFGGPNPADEGRAVVTDGSGNVYIAGLLAELPLILTKAPELPP